GGGRGFAVVASEVRELAQCSSRAAHEINDLIASSERQVKQGVELVDRAGEALRSIAEKVAEISAHISEISSAAGEQAKGIEETFASSATLIEAASHLRKLVDRFQIAAEDESWRVRSRVA
ncbi:MAG: methyl-accepting chemotaxis protein, partial [Rhodobacteraceae bacterium]